MISYPAPTSPTVSAVMRANRRTDTRPERALRSALHARGLRFRKDFTIAAADVRVRADVVFPACRVAVFVDGCFWHCCPEHGTRPGRNASYWTTKLANNVERDQRVTRALRERGWTVVRLWEHQTVGDACEEVWRAIEVARQQQPATVKR